MEKVKARVVEHPSPRGERSDRARRRSACRQSARMSSRSARSEVDGRFGRCVGCAVVVVFCEVCASVHARCVTCARQRRREIQRAANRRWGTSPAGRASGRRRQADFRARRRRRVTDPISTETARPPTSLAAPSSAVEPARPEEGSRASSLRSFRHPIQAMQCARCGRVLSGRVQPSERSAPRRPSSRRPRHAARGP